VKADRSALRASVRALVGFSIFPPDIMPVSKQQMELGRQGHLARQGASRAKAEETLRWESTAQGLPVQISGRMDLYSADEKPPVIEEIKLSPAPPPVSPMQEHLMQAACYGFMLTQRDSIPAVCLRVSYVTRFGGVTASFSETWEAERLRDAFFSLLLPWAGWQAKLISWKEARDASLKDLPFPYPEYRPGQREMAAQVYTAIARRRRLFAVMPTGTGKSAAAIYPALKALGQGLNEQVFCLTARGTQRVSAQKEADRMRGDRLRLHSLVLNAKEKLCPMEEMRCHPEHCERARGHFLRQQTAAEEALMAENWDTAFITETASRHLLCPFEFSLALCEIADLVICDYNYALDPQVRLSRIFDIPRGTTLLIDEAHNLPDRARDMLSGTIQAERLLTMRREAGRTHGRSGKLYKAYTSLIRTLASEGSSGEGGRLPDAAAELLSELAGTYSPGGAGLARDLIAFLSAWNRAFEQGDDYTILHDPDPRRGGVRVLCLNPAPHLKEATKRMAGCVYYSATLSPLDAMRGLLGGEREDACLSLPSPFPEEHLLSLQFPLNTRYHSRAASLLPAAEAILALYHSRTGKYIAYFPSFAYLRSMEPVLRELDPDLPLIVQKPGMDEASRILFLDAFVQGESRLLGLCVLGGVFAEGVDLPGEALIGAMIVGVGLPQVNPERERIRERLQEALGDGFGHAYRFPGMQKVLQAAGRLIRSERDRGVLLLMDDRYAQEAYSGLLPSHLKLKRVYSKEEITSLARAFWERN